MPELPEVETTLLGIKPHIEGRFIEKAVIRQYQLRWPIPKDLSESITGKQFEKLNRRGKYIILSLDTGGLLIHLGMTGCLRILSENKAPQKHDHVDIHLDNGLLMRYTDPRRFGAILRFDNDEAQHPLIKSLGPEPLEAEFNTDYLLKKTRGKRIAIKSLIMNSSILVGVGNIYAAEALFLARINPLMPSSELNPAKANELVHAIKKILQAAILQGGTTIKDFKNSEGKPGYFAQELLVYGRSGQPCRLCNTELCSIRLGQRATVYCPSCQA